MVALFEASPAAPLKYLALFLELIATGDLKKREPKKLDREALLTEIFKQMDDNESGDVSLDEYKQLMTVDDESTRAIFERIFKLTDTDKSSKLSLKEFVSFNIVGFANFNDEDFYRNMK